MVEAIKNPKKFKLALAAQFGKTSNEYKDSQGY